MRIWDLDWSDYIETHISEHEVAPHEVEQVVFENPNLILRGRAPGIYNVYGQTDGGRYLIVIVKVKDEGAAFVLTAREMDQAERTLYKKRK